MTCSRCGAAVTGTPKFCSECGAALTPAAPTADVRKTVTALFCDVTGSTALGSRLDPEALRHLMEDWFARASAVLARHGGTVEKFVGDAVMAVFGIPVAHEDDALRACRAAVELLAAAEVLDRDVVRDHKATFAVRIGVETGEVLVGDPSRGSTFASGTAVNTAARLEQAAGPGECLVGPESYRLVARRRRCRPAHGPRAQGAGRRPRRAGCCATSWTRPRSPARSSDGWSDATASSRCCARRSTARSATAPASSRPCSGSPGWASRASPRSSWTWSPSMPSCCAGAACPTATRSPGGRSSRWCAPQPG